MILDVTLQTWKAVSLFAPAHRATLCLWFPRVNRQIQSPVGKGVKGSFSLLTVARSFQNRVLSIYTNSFVFAVKPLGNLHLLPHF